MTGSKGELLRALLSREPYKSGQGSLVRGGTFGALLFLILCGAWAWMNTQAHAEAYVKWGLPVLVGIIAAWAAYRLVHYPRFADFLITTEAEMNKVSWPGKGELRASTAVVLVNVVLMALFLFVTDMFWQTLLRVLGILRIGGLLGGGSANMFHIPLVPEVLDGLRAWWS